MNPKDLKMGEIYWYNGERLEYFASDDRGHFFDAGKSTYLLTDDEVEKLIDTSDIHRNPIKKFCCVDGVDGAAQFLGKSVNDLTMRERCTVLASVGCDIHGTSVTYKGKLLRADVSDIFGALWIRMDAEGAPTTSQELLLHVLQQMNPHDKEGEIE